MKVISMLIFVVISLSSYATYEQDVKAIKNMTGCYKTTFRFQETFPLKEGYKLHPPYKSWTYEEVRVLEEAEGKISLQHTITDGDMVQKHWRQDWLYENEMLYNYYAVNKWAPINLNTDQASGRWTQKVYQVDDSPRYQCSAPFVHWDDNHYWECQTMAPPPRRDMTKRNDYNMMQRKNRHEITHYGHVHIQDNLKINISDENVMEMLTMEAGRNSYARVDDSHCKSAVPWWDKHGPFWKIVRETWSEVEAMGAEIHFNDMIDGRKLWYHIFRLDRKFARDTASAETYRERIRTLIYKSIQ